MLPTANKNFMSNARASWEKQVFSYYTAAIFTEYIARSVFSASNNHQFFFSFYVVLQKWSFLVHKNHINLDISSRFSYRLTIDLVELCYLLVTFIPKTAGCWFDCLFCSANDVVRGLPLMFRYLYKLMKMPYTLHWLFTQSLCQNYVISLDKQRIFFSFWWKSKFFTFSSFRFTLFFDRTIFSLEILSFTSNIWFLLVTSSHILN